MRRTSVRSLCLCCALAWLVAAGCGGDDPFTDAAPGPDGPTVDAVTVDAMEDAAAPDADGTAPDTTITDAPADPDNDATPTFAFSSDDAAATFECRVDNQTFAPCTSPHTTGALADGAHTFEVRAVDGADNADATAAAHAWTIDTDAPDTLIETAPPPLDNSPDVTFAFVADEVDSTFECRVDGGAFAPCASPHTVLDLPDGDRTFAVRAVDPAGNADATPATYDWTLDATTPNTVIDSGPPDPDNQVAATFTFSSPNVGVGGTFACALDGGAFAACTSPHTVTGLAEGEHTFAVRVTDGAGNPDPTPAERTWEVDLTPPDTTLTATPSDPTSQPAGTFAFSSEAGATFECRVDGDAFAPCASPFTTTALADGDHAVEVRAVDDAGNADPTPAAFAWEVDTAAPDTTITAAPAALTSQISASFQFASSEAGGTFHCRLDAGGFVPCASPFGFPGLAPGSHTVQIRAVDLAGNVDASPASHTWVIDTAPPDTAITVAPASPTAATSASFEFTSEAGATFQCRLDGGAYAACTSPHAYAGLAGGTHTFEVRAIDAAGNVDPGAAQHTWAIDLTAPDTSIVAAPDSPTIETTATFTFIATEAAATFECRLDGGAFAACTSPQTYPGLAATSHTFQVRAIDVVGNIDGSPASRTWTIDGAPPDTTINLSPPALTNQTSALFGFASSESGSTFQCAVDGGAFAACTSPRSVTGLSAGAHTFAVRAIDPVGNVDPTPASHGWTVDTAAPDTTITATPANPTAQTSASFAFTATEAGSTFQCRLDGQPFAACTAPRAYTGLGAGSHTFDVRAVDPAGNVDASPASYTWAIDLAPPDTTITAAPPQPSSSTSATFQFTSTEPGSSFACSLDGGAYAACTSPRAITGLAAGAHTFAVRATDPAGGTDPTPATHAWTIDLVAPDTTITSAPSSPTTDTTATFAFTGSEAGVTFQCRVDAAAFAACTSPHVVSGLTAGTFTFEVRATDPAGNVDATPASHTWTVDLAAPDTTVLSGPASPTSQTAASFTFSATEAGATFECRLDGGAFAACTSPRSYTGLVAGAHSFEVRATDTGGNTDPTPAAYAWTVDLTPPDTALADLPADPTNQTTASITLTSEAGATFECRLDGGAFAACTSPHALSGLGAGAHTFEARATDVAGNTDPSPASHTWTVDLSPPETTIDSGPSGTVSATTATFTFSSEGGATFECSVDGAAFATCASGVAYGSLADGAHTFAVRARDAAGNVDASPATRGWTVDATAPTTTIDGGPPDPSGSTSATFTFSSNEAGATFECRVDADAFASCISGDTFAVTEGAHTFEVRAIDAALNVDVTPASYAWTVDTTPPETAIDSDPQDPGSDSPSFSFSSDDANATFECALDGEAFAPCTSPQAYAGLADGEHDFQVRAVDEAGNVDASPAQEIWTIATAAEVRVVPWWTGWIVPFTQSLVLRR